MIWLRVWLRHGSYLLSATSLVALTITKVSSSLDTLRKDVTYSDEVKHAITISVTYENINYPNTYDMSWTLLSNSTITDSKNDVVNSGGIKNDKDISKGETNTMTFSIKTKQLASKIDYLTFKYYYPQSLLRGSYSEEDFLIIKVPVDH